MVFSASGAQLSSSIPASLGSLSQMSLFDVSSNALTGVIPPRIWEGWSNVKEVDMSQNTFSVESVLTGEIGNWVSCTKLEMASSGIGGSIPPEIGGMTSLEVLDLSSNSLTGELPAEIGQLVEMEELVLFGNGLNGTIPTVIGGLSKLEIFLVNENGLDGTIPTELGLLEDLELIQLHMNKLSELAINVD